MSIEEQIRKIVNEELDKRQTATSVIPLNEFCRKNNISRSTVWRAEKEGRIKLHRVKRKVFINPHDWVA